MTRQEKKEELIGLFAVGAIFIGDLIDECFDFGQQQPCWISVEDELPKTETEVLMVSSGCADTLCGYRCKVGKNRWYCYNDDEYWHNITHWMPMPQPPILSKSENAHIIGTEEHIKVALDVLDKKGSEE